MPVSGDNIQTATVTLAGGKSAALDISGARSVGLVFPATMDAVAVTFEGSTDGTTFFPVSVMLTPTTQAVLTLASPTASKAISLPQELAAFNFIKIVAAVAADRTVLVATGT